MKIAVLGPKGTYSDEATSRFPLRGEKVFCNSIYEVFQAVENGECEYGVLPFENSIHGTVLETIDLLRGAESKIIDETIVDIHHNIAVLEGVKKEDIKQIFSHPQALAQSAQYLKKNYPNVKTTETPSTSFGFKEISEKNLKDSAAIGSKFAAEAFYLQIIDQNIEDFPNNKTLFLLISKITNHKPTKYTYLAVLPHQDYPGLLFDILNIFKDLKINLKKIESRPERTELGKYLFYFKLDISSEDEEFKEMTKRLEEKEFEYMIMNI